MLAAFAVLAFGAPAVTAAEPPTAGVEIVSPRGDQPAFGEVAVEIAVWGGEAELVRLFLQGREVGTRHSPPWVFSVDFGQENNDRKLRALAVLRDGRTVEHQLAIAAVRVDEAIDLALQPIYVTARRHGQRVLDLAREDFVVRDNGVQQQLVTFERGEVPLTAVLLVDSSLSMRGPPLAAALRGARAFVAAMAPLDQASLLLFADRILLRSPFAHEPTAIERALTAVRADGGTALNDNLYLALHLLAAESGRRVIILLSDGVDVDSVLPIADVAATAARTNALVYWLRLRMPGREGDRLSIWRDAEEHRRELAGLAALVQASGGEIRDLPSIAAAEAAFTEVLAELREQYVLGYYPRGTPPGVPWHRIEVRVAQPDVELRHRAGYFVD